MSEVALLSPAVVGESQAVLATHARSFRWASAFLPAAARDDAAVVYHLCRLIDDTVDEAPDQALAAVEAADLRAELTGSRPARPLVAEFRRRMAGLGAEPGPELALLDAVVSDLEPARVADDAELLRYAYGVAGTVGLLMCPVIGVTDKVAAAHALDLGIGMQLTNICRDVKEDAALGRVYLPESRLVAHGTSQAALLAGTAPREAVSAVVLELLALAERYYASADQGMRFIPLRCRAAIYVAARVYRGIGLKLGARGGDALAGRTVVPWWGKAVLVLQGLSAMLTGSLRSVRGHEAELHGALVGLPGVREA